MKKLNIAYFGSPDFSAFFLEKLLTDTLINQLIEVKFVITQPDRKVGRKQILSPTPVKKIASNFQFPIFNFQSNLNFQNSENEKSMTNKKFKMKISQIDLALVYAYGQLIPKELLNLPKYGFWCIHPSLLPLYRGTSPMATALINGDKTTGVTIYKMDELIDHGPIIAQENYTILETDKRPDLEKKLTDLAFAMFNKIMKDEEKKFFRFRGDHEVVRLSCDKNLDSESFLKPQKHESASYTKKLTKQDGFIEFKNLKLKIKNSPEKLYNLFRGLYPWPGLWTILPNKKRLKIIDLKLIPNPYSLIPTRVQLEGKKEVDFKTFNQAYCLF